MKVTALVSTYNASSLIGDCLDNLISQTLYQDGHLEIIVIDSGSQEHEADIVRSFQNKNHRIKYIRSKHRETLYEAWNRGIQIATGDYITNANTDDRHAPDCLEKLSNALDQEDSIGLVYGKINKVFSLTGDQPSKKPTVCLSQEFCPASLFLHYFYGPQPMWRASIHEDLGMFSGLYSVLGDYEFALRLIEKGVSSKYVPDASGDMLWHENALSTRDFTAISEKTTITQNYRNYDKIIKVYQSFISKAGLTSEEFLNNCLLDLGLRSLCFFPQFNEGNPTIDLEWFAFCNPVNWRDPRFVNNRAIHDYFLGNPIDSFFYKLASEEKTFYLSHNLKVLTGKKESENLYVCGSKLSLNSESTLKAKSCSYLTREKTKEFEGDLFSLNLTKLHKTFLHGINLEQILGFKKIFLWGANDKAKLIFYLFKRKGHREVFLLDANIPQKRKLSYKIISPQFVLSKNEKGCCFILCMSKIHWKKVKNEIRVTNPSSPIFTLSS